MSASQTARTVAARQGWTDATLLAVVLDYIDGRGDGSGFAAFLRSVADDETSEDDELVIDASRPEWPRLVAPEHLEADERHEPTRDTGDDTCMRCGLAVTSDGKRHGWDA